MIRTFGTEEYGDANEFSLICNKCGRTASIVPIHFYENSIDEHPEKIDLELRCVCGNKYGATIHHSNVKLKTERIDK